MGKAALATFGRCDVQLNIAGGRGPVEKTFRDDTPEEFIAIPRRDARPVARRAAKRFSAPRRRSARTMR